VLAVLQRYGKKFSMMISVDGYGEVHDRQRGRPGNFASAMRVFEHFKDRPDVPLAIACTITKQNVWKVDELLDFMMEQGIYGRFRVAEFINRLYNNDLKAQIRNFDEAERYHLAGFFLRLILQFERNERFQRTYWSIINILTGGQRSIGCYYQSKGLVLDSRGQIQYCAPKGQPLGSLLEKDGYALFKQSLKQRRAILDKHCDDCIHDYHYDETYPERKALYQKAFWRKALSIEGSRQWAGRLAWLPLGGKRFARTTVFITGWYGTETVGDKAILMGIVQHYQKEYPQGVDFIISALYPFVTERSLVELDLKARVVATESADFVRAALGADVTVMGGGPLMGIEALAIPLAAFELAAKAGKQRVIFGCGLGPLQHQRHLDVVTRMLQLSTTIRLRDKASIAWAERLSGRKDIEYWGDPAFHYLQSLSQSQKGSDKKPILACFLRDWSEEYQGSLSREEFAATKASFEAKLAAEIKAVAKAFDLSVHFYCMHTFVVGGDDRIFYRRFVREHFADFPVYLEQYPSSVASIVGAMQQASYCLCMRFHSVLFAHTLGANFLAIDYTGGGKIKGFLSDHGALQRMVGLQELAQEGSPSLVARMSE
jgi:polysaccharide pyruvyl transferase WcaK-like protein